MEQTPTKRTTRQNIRLFLTGVAMGSADVVPGVSGGTMAFILGIYEELIDAIKSFNLPVIKLVLSAKIGQALGLIPWRFLVVLGLGVATAILSLSNILTWLLENERTYLYAFFFGLILASIIAVGTRVTRWTAITIAPLLAGSAIAFFLAGISPAQNADHSAITLFLSGMVAIMATILPGISGSFILLLLGQYEYVLTAIKDFDLQTIAVVGAGAFIGVTGFSRVLSWLLKYYEQATIAALTGFMIGSLRKIWPWQQAILDEKELVEGTKLAEHASEFTRPFLPEFASSEFALALVLCIIGFLIVSFLDHLQSRSNPVVLVIERAAGKQLSLTPKVES